MAEDKISALHNLDVNHSVQDAPQVESILRLLLQDTLYPTSEVPLAAENESTETLDEHQDENIMEEVTYEEVLEEVDEEEAFDMVFDTSGTMPVSPSNVTNMMVCRICHGCDSVEKFLSPCKCKGTLSKVHKTCLEHWLAESDTSYCELCGHEYVTERVPQYSLLPSIFKWVTSHDSWRDIRDLLIDLVVMCIFTPMIVMGTYAGIVTTENLYRLDLMSSSIQIPMTPTRLISLTLVFFTATMDLVYTSWMVVRFQHHVGQWHRWWRRKCVVRLVIEKNHKHLVTTNQEEEPITNFD